MSISTADSISFELAKKIFKLNIQTYYDYHNRQYIINAYSKVLNEKATFILLEEQNREYITLEKHIFDAVLRLFKLEEWISTKIVLE